MAVFMLSETQEEQLNNNQENQELENLVDFFDLLLKIDMRENPLLYRQEQDYD